jgi:hypothetical protein
MLVRQKTIRLRNSNPNLTLPSEPTSLVRLGLPISEQADVVGSLLQVPDEVTLP